MSKERVLINARRLVQKAVDIADRVGIEPSQVVAPYCAETAAGQPDEEGRSSDNLEWCGVSVIIDDDTDELFEMSKPDDDTEQKPAFQVTNQPQISCDRISRGIGLPWSVWQRSGRKINGLCSNQKTSD